MRPFSVRRDSDTDKRRQEPTSGPLGGPSAPAQGAGAPGATPGQPSSPSPASPQPSAGPATPARPVPEDKPWLRPRPTPEGVAPASAASAAGSADAAASGADAAASDAAVPQAAPAPTGQPRGNENTLIVGPNIRLKGEIGACDTLVVEGHIEASMDSHHIAVAEGGVFNGEVTVDTAEVAGSFDGELTVRQRLLVRSTGRIAGSVRYGALEVENGGQISGNIELLRDGARRTSAGPKPAAGSASAPSEVSSAS